VYSSHAGTSLVKRPTHGLQQNQLLEHAAINHLSVARVEKLVGHYGDLHQIPNTLFDRRIDLSIQLSPCLVCYQAVHVFVKLHIISHVRQATAHRLESVCHRPQIPEYSWPSLQAAGQIAGHPYQNISYLACIAVEFLAVKRLLIDKLPHSCHRAYQTGSLYPQEIYHAV